METIKKLDDESYEITYTSIYQKKVIEEQLKKLEKRKENLEKQIEELKKII